MQHRKIIIQKEEGSVDRNYTESVIKHSFSLPVSSLAHDCLFRIALSSKYWVLVSKKTSKYAKKTLPK